MANEGLLDALPSELEELVSASKGDEVREEKIGLTTCEFMC